MILFSNMLINIRAALIQKLSMFLRHLTRASELVLQQNEIMTAWTLAPSVRGGEHPLMASWAKIISSTPIEHGSFSSGETPMCLA